MFEDSDSPLRFPEDESATVSMGAAEPVRYPSRLRRFVISKVVGGYCPKIGAGDAKCICIGKARYPTKAEAFKALGKFCSEKRATEILGEAEDKLARFGLRLNLKEPKCLPL